MSNKHWWLRAFKTISMISILGMSMTACGAGSVKWNEEVQLSDGRVIVIERETVRERGGDEWAFNRSGTKPKEYRIRFSYPDGSRRVIEWRSKKETGTWPEIPLILDMESEQLVVFSDVSNSAGCHIYSKYRYQDSAWVEEKLPQRFERRITNLLIFDDKDMQQFINLETKRQKNSDSHTLAFRHVGPIHPYCR
jgi:hypothetical protein